MMSSFLLNFLSCLAVLVLQFLFASSAPNPVTRTLTVEEKVRLLDAIDTNTDELSLVQCSIHDEPFIVQVHRDWSPLGAGRFLELVSDNFFTGMALFRAINNFLVQFGIPDNLDMSNKWRVEHNMDDDPKIPVSDRFDAKIPFVRGVMSYAGSGLNTRSTQMFFTLVKSTDWLGREAWETPFAMIIDNIEILEDINTEYDDNPQQGLIWQQGYSYLKREFPNLTYLDYCDLVDPKDVLELSQQLEISAHAKSPQNAVPNNPEEVVADPAAGKNEVVEDAGNVGDVGDAEKQNLQEGDGTGAKGLNEDDGQVPEKPVEIKHDIDEIRAKLREKRQGGPRDGVGAIANDAVGGVDANVEQKGAKKGVAAQQQQQQQQRMRGRIAEERGRKRMENYNPKSRGVGNKNNEDEEEFATTFQRSVEVFEIVAIIALIVGIVWGILRIQKGEKQA